MILRWLNNLSLRVKLILPMWALLTAGIIVLGAVIEDVGTQKLEQSLISRTEILAKVAASNLTGALAFDDKQTATEQMESLTVDPDFIGARVWISQGKPFAEVMQLPTDCRTTEKAVVCSERNIERVEKPIWLGGESLGVIEVYMSRESIETERQYLVSYLTAGAGFISLLALLFAKVMHRIVSFPMASLRQSMTSMLRLGVFGRPIPVRHNDEIGQLTACFNDLIQSLSERDQQLKQTLSQLEVKSQYIGEMLDTMEHGVMVIAPGEVVTYFNPAAQTLLKSVDCEPHDLDKLLETFHPVPRVLAISKAIDMRQPLKGVEVTHIETGKVFQVSTQPMAGVFHSLVQFEDVTGQKEAEQRRRLAEVIFDKSQDATLVLSRNMQVKTQNAACIRAFGAQASWQSLSGEEHQPLGLAELKSLLRNGAIERQRSFISERGASIPCRVTVRTLTNHKGRIDGFVVTLIDQSAKLEIERLHHLANHDNLTGLANRAHALYKLTHDHDKGKSMNVLFIDLDGFKRVNDQFGHQVGDELLKVVADRLRGAVSRHDFVSRLSGDEFLVALYGNVPVERVANRLLSRLRSEIVINNLKPQISASIGIRHWHATEKISLTEVIKQADQAMYEAKAQGKDGYAFYETELQASSNV